MGLLGLLGRMPRDSQRTWLHQSRHPPHQLVVAAAWKFPVAAALQAQKSQRSPHSLEVSQMRGLSNGAGGEILLGS